MNNLDKARQKQCLKWLKSQTKQHKKQIRISVMIGFLSAMSIILQAGMFAIILQKLIIDKSDFDSVLTYFVVLIAVFLLRSLLSFLREQTNYKLGQQIRKNIRQQLLNKIESNGPLAMTGHESGGLSTLFIEQVENLHDFYARYLPQMRLASMVPILIFFVILPINWAAAVILLATAPLIPIFMILVGMGAADVNRKNFKALARLSGHFLDRVKGLTTIKLFHQGENQSQEIYKSAEDFRLKTMNVLKMAFLSSAVLEFFTSISIAVVAVYYGFSYLGEFHFGSYNSAVTLFSGFFALILAPEFFQPLRDLGTYYHAKASAIAAADNIEAFLSLDVKTNIHAESNVEIDQIKTIEAQNLIILSPDGKAIVGPLNFTLISPFRLSLMGESGSGKTSLLNVLMGFLPYDGSLKINQTEFSQLNIHDFRAKISWLGQNPYLINGTVADNLKLANPNASEHELNKVLTQVKLMPFIKSLPDGIKTHIGEDAVRVSVGQAQRIALARALLKPCHLMLLDEPTASLDKATAKDIEAIINEEYHAHNLIMVTHQKTTLVDVNQHAYLDNNQLKITKRADEC